MHSNQYAHLYYVPSLMITALIIHLKKKINVKYIKFTRKVNTDNKYKYIM